MTLVFDKCCGCIDLRTGCLIIGYLNLIGNIILIIMDIIAIGALGFISSSNEAKPEQREAAYILFIVTIILLLFLIVFLAFTIVLLVGLHKEKRGHVKAFLIYATIFIVITIIKFLAGFATPPISVGGVLQELFTILLNIYFLLCIRSYYIKMGDSSMRPAIYNTA